MIALWSAVLGLETAAQVGGSSASQGNMSAVIALRSSSTPTLSDASQATAAPQAPEQPFSTAISKYEGKVVQSIEIPGVADSEREHILQLLPQKLGEPLERGK